MTRFLVDKGRGAGDRRARRQGCGDERAGGKLVIEPIEPKRRKRRYTLDELVGSITPQNRHDEIDWGVGTKPGDGEPEYCPEAGDLVWIDLNPTLVHHEQSGRRPALVLTA